MRDVIQARIAEVTELGPAGHDHDGEAVVAETTVLRDILADFGNVPLLQWLDDFADMFALLSSKPAPASATWIKLKGFAKSVKTAGTCATAL